MVKKKIFERFSFSVPMILLVAAGLRLWGIGFGLPDLFHADEPIVVNHALQFGSGDFNPHFFNIPPLASYLLFGIYGVLYLIGKIFGFWENTIQFAEHFFRDPTIFYLLGRVTLGVIPAVASVYLLMAWMRKFFSSEKWVYLAGSLFAVCFVHVSDAHYIYADMSLILVCLIFFYLLHSLDIKKEGSHLKLGLLIGLAMAFKYNGVFLVAPYLWMHGRLSKTLIHFLMSSLIAALGTLLAFSVLNPFAILDPAFFLNELREQSAANQGVPFWHHLTYSLAEGMSWPLVILGVLGGVRTFFSRDVRREIVSVFCLIYYFVLWKKGQPYGRYILPLVPFLIILAIEAALAMSKKNIILRMTAFSLLIYAVGWNIAKDIRFNWIMAQPDVRAEASQWIEENIPSGSKIALDGTSFTPQLSFSCEQLQGKLNGNQNQDSTQFKRIQARLRVCNERPSFNLFFLTDRLGSNPFLFTSPEILFNSEKLIKKQIRYVVLVAESQSSASKRGLLGNSAKLIKIWEPRPPQSSDLVVFDAQVITGGPFTWKDLWSRTANGYRIELYDLDAVAVR